MGGLDSWVHWDGLVEQGVRVLSPALHYQGLVLDKGCSISRSNRSQGVVSGARYGLNCIIGTVHIVPICMSLDFIGFLNLPLVLHVSEGCLGLSLPRAGC